MELSLFWGWSLNTPFKLLKSVLLKNNEPNNNEQYLDLKEWIITCKRVSFYAFWVIFTLLEWKRIHSKQLCEIFTVLHSLSQAIALIHFKVLVFVFKCLNNTAPSYLASNLHYHTFISYFKSSLVHTTSHLTIINRYNPACPTQNAPKWICNQLLTGCFSSQHHSYGTNYLKVFVHLTVL